MSSEIARRVVNSMQKKKKSSEDFELLTDREKEILDYLAKGFLYKEIATRLDIGYETVHRHVSNIYQKLHVRSRNEAVLKYLHR